jgi:hypothetical protein
MPLQGPPASYEDLIEGQPAKEGPYPGFSDRGHLRPGWPVEFAKQKYFRVVGFAETLEQAGLTLGNIRPHWQPCLTRMLDLVPQGWKKSHHFSAELTKSLRADQIEAAARNALQRFDRAALSILFLHAALERLGVDWPLYRYVRLRPVTYYVDGFGRVWPAIAGNAGALQALKQVSDQSLLVLERMADGHWYVTRKTADLVLRALQKLAQEGTISGSAAAGLEVKCGRLRRLRRTLWPIEQESVSFMADEYLSPAAWSLVPRKERSQVQPPPF